MCLAMGRILMRRSAGLGAILLTLVLTVSSSADVVEDEVAVRDVLSTVPFELLEQNRSIAADHGFAALGGFSVLAGHDSNIHRSPDSLEQSSMLGAQWLYGRGYAVFPDDSRLLATLEVRRIGFSEASGKDDRYGKLSIWHRRTLTRGLNLELDFDASSSNDHATRITGEDYLRDYSYKRLSFEGLVVLYPASNHRLKLGTEYIVKNYDEITALNTLDWTELSFLFNYRFRFGPYHYLRLGFSTGIRAYEAELASDTLGNETISNPPERHRYTDASLWYSRANQGHYEYNLGFALRFKEDRFQDYESYTATVVTASGAYWPIRILELRTTVEWSNHDFDLLPADGGVPLEYSRWEFALSSRLQINRNIWLIGSAQHFDRDSNLRSGISYRSYRGSTFTLGLGVFF